MLLALLLPALPCCSVLEDRGDCPCLLDVELRGEGFTQAPYCSVWNGPDMLFGSRMEGRAVECPVFPRSWVSVVLSSCEPTGDHICAPQGSQMPELLSCAHTVGCLGDEAFLPVGEPGRRFCELRLRVDESALPFRERLLLTVEAPYDGVTFPGLEAREGVFRCPGRFDEKGLLTLRVPPQGGPGLTLRIALQGGSTSSVDLYRIMRDNLYDWTLRDLPAFACDVSLSGISGACVVLDWHDSDLGPTEY